MVQVCSRCLDIPVSKIHIIDTATDKVPNSSPTAASSSSDLYGMAIKVLVVYAVVMHDFILLLKDACDQINERIRPFKEKDPSAGWNQWVSNEIFVTVC